MTEPKPPPRFTDQTNLDEGIVTLTMPFALSRDSFDEFEAWIGLVVRRHRRLANSTKPPPAPE